MLVMWWIFFRNFIPFYILYERILIMFLPVRFYRGNFKNNISSDTRRGPFPTQYLIFGSGLVALFDARGVPKKIKCRWGFRNFSLVVLSNPFSMEFEPNSVATWACLNIHHSRVSNPGIPVAMLGHRRLNRSPTNLFSC